MTVKGAKLATWIENHLWAILAVAFGLYGGYTTGQATMEARIATLEKEVQDLKRVQGVRRPFMACAVRNLDRLHDKLELQPACPLVITD